MLKIKDRQLYSCKTVDFLVSPLFLTVIYHLQHHHYLYNYYPRYEILILILMKIHTSSHQFFLCENELNRVDHKHLLFLILFIYYFHPEASVEKVSIIAVNYFLSDVDME